MPSTGSNWVLGDNPGGQGRRSLAPPRLLPILGTQRCRVGVVEAEELVRTGKEPRTGVVAGAVCLLLGSADSWCSIW